MNHNHIEKQLAKIHSKTRSLANQVWRLKSEEVLKSPEQYEAKSLDVVHQAERLACSLRGLAGMAPGSSKSCVISNIYEDHGISIAEKDGLITITLPTLLPKKRTGLANDFITDPLFYALHEEALLNPRQKFRKCVIVFEQVYDHNLQGSMMRDYDNNEFKPVLDIVSTFFLVDDSPEWCQTFHTARYGEKNETRVHLLEPGRFPEWYQCYQKQ